MCVIIRSSDSQTSAHCCAATEGGEEEENKEGDSGCANRKVPKPVQENKGFKKTKQKQNRAAGSGETKVR